MTLLTAGYWPTTYWSENYWNDDYWQEYVEVPAEFLLITLSHGNPINVTLSHGNPINVTLSQEVA